MPVPRAGLAARFIPHRRALVVEYKGEHLFADAEAKRAVGAVWESRSGGKCLFVMPEGNDLEAITKKIAANK